MLFVSSMCDHHSHVVWQCVAYAPESAAPGIGGKVSRELPHYTIVVQLRPILNLQSV